MVVKLTVLDDKTGETVAEVELEQDGGVALPDYGLRVEVKLDEGRRHGYVGDGFDVTGGR